MPNPIPAGFFFASCSMKWRCLAGDVSWMPVVSSSSPPDSQGVGSSNSEMWTHLISLSACSEPATSLRSHPSARLPTVSIRLLSAP